MMLLVDLITVRETILFIFYLCLCTMVAHCFESMTS